MKISLHKLLQKMAEEIKQAQASTSETKTRERIQAIKTLCELVLDEPENKQKLESVPTMLAQPLTINQSQRLQVDDEANGESLFDF